MKYTIAFAIALLLTLVAVCVAEDWDKDPHKMLSTLKPDQKYEELGMIVFCQEKKTSLSDELNSTTWEAVKTLEELGQKMGADKVVGINFTPFVVGDNFRIIVSGTAIKYVKQ